MKKKDDQLTFHINYVNRVYPIIIMVLCLMIIGGLYVVNSEVLEANSLISEFQRTDTGKNCTVGGIPCSENKIDDTKEIQEDAKSAGFIGNLKIDDGYDPNVCDHIQTHCGDDGQCKETCDMDAE